MPTSLRDIIAIQKMRQKYGNGDGQGKFTSAYLRKKNPDSPNTLGVTFRADGTYTFDGDEPETDTKTD